MRDASSNTCRSRGRRGQAPGHRGCNPEGAGDRRDERTNGSSSSVVEPSMTRARLRRSANLEIGLLFGLVGGAGGWLVSYPLHLAEARGNGGATITALVATGCTAAIKVAWRECAVV